MLHDFKPSQLHLRNTILFLSLSDQELAAIDRRMKKVYKEDAPVKSVIYKWHSKSGDNSIEDEYRPGRSMKLDLDLLRSRVEADPYQTALDLAVTLGKNTVIRGLKSIGKVLELGRWVPHALKQYDMGRRHSTSHGQAHPHLALATAHRG
nr:SET domain and mariner transposase fusion gene [Haemonchus contortus]